MSGEALPPELGVVVGSNGDHIAATGDADEGASSRAASALAEGDGVEYVSPLASAVAAGAEMEYVDHGSILT